MPLATALSPPSLSRSVSDDCARTWSGSRLLASDLVLSAPWPAGVGGAEAPREGSRRERPGGPPARGRSRPIAGRTGTAPARRPTVVGGPGRPTARASYARGPTVL